LIFDQQPLLKRVVPAPAILVKKEGAKIIKYCSAKAVILVAEI
jgi:hypothetical protein